MIDHTADCRVLTTGRCTCRDARTRYVNTDPRYTWLGDTKFEHPRSCAVYRAQSPNWAHDCDCWIGRMQDSQSQHPYVPMTDPSDFTVPKEYRPLTFESHAPWWVWTLIGFGGGVGLAEVLQRTLGV